MKTKAKTAYKAHIASGGELTSQSTERALGVLGNGVSYVVHDMYPMWQNASATCGEHGEIQATSSMALALSKDSHCEKNDDGTMGSVKFVGCSDMEMQMEWYDSWDCTGNMYQYNHPLMSCGMFEEDPTMYVGQHCRAKYPFKMQAGALFR